MTIGRPPGSGSNPAGYDRPETMPDDPSEVALRAHERSFVSQKRAAHVSWQNIARMLGVAESDLRARWEGLV